MFRGVSGITGSDSCWSAEWWRCARNAAGMASRHRFRGFRGRFRDDERKSFLAGTWRRGGDGEVLGDGEAGPGGRERGPAGRGAGGGAGRPAEQFAGLAAWAADEAGYLDHGEREKVIGQEGRELQRRLLQATFDVDSAREERADGVTSAAGIRHGIVEEDHGRGVTSVFGPVRVTRKAYRNRREPNLYPADARLDPPRRPVLPGDAGPGGLSPGRGRVRAGPGGHRGPHRRHGRPRPAHRAGRGSRGLDGRLLRGTGPGRGRRTCRAPT